MPAPVAPVSEAPEAATPAPVAPEAATTPPAAPAAAEAPEAAPEAAAPEAAAEASEMEVTPSVQEVELQNRASVVSKALYRGPKGIQRHPKASIFLDITHVEVLGLENPRLGRA